MRRTFLVIVAVACTCVAPAVGQNKVIFDNKSGEPALVKLVGPACKEVEVPDASKVGVDAVAGCYFVKIRYGLPKKYRYVKGAEFDVEERPTATSETTITLHKVIAGNYASEPISEEEFGRTAGGKVVSAFWEGIGYASEGDFEKALKTLKEATGSGDAYDEPLECVALCRSVGKGQLARDYGLHFFKGMVSAYKESYDESIAQFKACITAEPARAIAYVELASVHLLKEDTSEAVALLRKALHLDPKNGRTHELLGLAYEQMGDFDNAISELNQAIVINPKDVSAHFNLGMLYGNHWKRDEARKELERTLEIDPSHAEAHARLAVAYFREKEYEKAASHCDRALELGYDVPKEFVEAVRKQRK